MPYTAPEARAHMDLQLPDGIVFDGVGDLTYAITRLLNNYLAQNGVRYQHIAEISGALHQAGRDFDERIVEPYEHKKVLENGEAWNHDVLNAAGAVGYPFKVLS